MYNTRPQNLIKLNPLARWLALIWFFCLTVNDYPWSKWPNLNDLEMTSEDQRRSSAMAALLAYTVY